MLYIRFSDLIYFITESFYPFTNLSLFPPPPSPWQPLFCSLNMSSIYFFKKKIPHVNHTMNPWVFGLFLFGLFHPPQYPKWNIVCVCVCLCVYTHIHIYYIFLVHWSVDDPLVSFHTLAVMNNATTNLRVQLPLLDSSFVLFWIYTQKLD